MRQGKITHTQLTALIWAGVLAPAAERLPVLTVERAGRGAWLAVVCAIPLVLAGGWLLSGLSREGGAARTLRRCLGPWAGRGVLLIYLCWFELLLALRLRLCAQRLLSTGRRDGSLWFFLVVTAGLALWMGMGKLSAFARTGQVLLAVLLATGGIVLLLSAGQVRPERLLPLSWEEGTAAVWGALPAAGVLGWGVCGAFLAGQVARSEDRGRWHWIFWGAGGCGLLALAQGIIIGNLGAELAGELESPFFALAKSVGVEGAFQRVESVVAALWTFSDLAMAGLLLFGIRALWKETGPPETERKSAAVFLLLAMLLALSLFSGGAETALWSRYVIPPGNLMLGLAVPALLRLLLLIYEKKQKGGISCGKNQGKGVRYCCSKRNEKKSEKNEKKC